MSDTLIRLRYRLWPDHLLGEILSKRWTETAIPVVALVLVTIWLGSRLDGFYTVAQFAATGRQAAEIGLVVLGLALVMIVGGIDLSVGSMFALSNLCALVLMNILRWPVAAAVAATLAVGTLLGAVNGVLVGYLRLRAFLTTLITLIIYRAVYELLSLQYATTIAGSLPDSQVWDAMGTGNVAGVPVVVWVYIFVALFAHIFLTRLRVGWHVIAIGGSRRSAFNCGIAVHRTIAGCYAASGFLTALGAIFFASRLSSASGDIGSGLEITALTAAVVGGISLGGGRGSVTKAMVGTLVVLMLTNGLTSMSAPGGVTQLVLAIILIVSAVIDIRWLKNRDKIINNVYVSPTYNRLAPAPSCLPGAGAPFEVNDRLRDVELIGLGRIEGPEDVILDRCDHLYTVSRQGDIVRFFAPDYQRMEIFAHIGGTPLGMSFDRSDNLYVCVGGMGLYRVTPKGEVEKATDETNRYWGSINDDSRLRLADDCDVADDGCVYFSEATTRYEMHDWAVDGLEARGNGRIICYDPRTNKTHTALRNRVFPNGICMAHDGESLFFAETWRCAISRFWFAGPKKGVVELVIDNLPGYPDNINQASDGNFWLALTGMRTPVFDLAMQLPGVRKRMVKRLPFDEWMFPNINVGCVLKFSAAGEVIESLWDRTGANHPMITSMREHRGYLYLGGLSNNRIGRIHLPNADRDFVQYDRRWKSA